MDIQNYYEEFIAKLQEIFMMDHAELDFGIYRIMNQKRDDIMDFLENRLLKQVGSSLDIDEKEVEKLQKRQKEILQMCLLQFLLGRNTMPTKSNSAGWATPRNSATRFSAIL